MSIRDRLGRDSPDQGSSDRDRGAFVGLRREGGASTAEPAGLGRRLGGAGGAVAAITHSRFRTLNYGLASFLVMLCASVGLYSWAT